MDERRIPPDDPTDEELTTADWKTEYDVTATLERLGHDVHVLGVGGDLNVIRRTLDEVKPDVVFNLLEDFHDVPIYDQNVVSYLEILRVPYTGCNPRGLMLARDKALSKALLASHRIPVPDYAVFRIGRKVRRPRRLTFPLIVKSLTKEGSEGIARHSVVDSDERLAERVRFVHERLGTHAIAERYIDGRELYVGVIGNERLQVFPVWELLFERLPEGRARAPAQRPPARLLRAAPRGRAADRDRARQVEPQVPGEGRRQDGRGEEPVRRAGGAHPAAREAHLPDAPALGLRAHRHAPRRRGAHLRPRGEPEPADRLR